MLSRPGFHTLSLRPPAHSVNAQVFTIIVSSHWRELLGFAGALSSGCSRWYFWNASGNL